MRLFFIKPSKDVGANDARLEARVRTGPLGEVMKPLQLASLMREEVKI